MDEDIRLALALREEAEAAQAVEPLHHGRLQTARRHHLNMGAGKRQFGGMQGS